MRAARRWAGGLIAGWGLLGVLSCGGGAEDEDGPSASDREARSDVLRGMVASQQSLPQPETLDAQGEELRRGEPLGKEVKAGSAAAKELYPPSLSGTVAGLEEGSLWVVDGQGNTRVVRLDAGTRYVKQNELVKPRAVREGARVRVFYEMKQGQRVARDVELVEHDVVEVRGARTPEKEKDRAR
ncbi:hypothetical protein P2318_33065 [Myxococcaceae bacterium GXIMD 01537]